MTTSVFSSDTITIKTPIRLLELFCTTYHEVPNNRWGRGFHANNGLKGEFFWKSEQHVLSARILMTS